jgi:hypothetical protein
MSRQYRDRYRAPRRKPPRVRLGFLGLASRTLVVSGPSGRMPITVRDRAAMATRTRSRRYGALVSMGDYLPMPHQNERSVASRRQALRAQARWPANRQPTHANSEREGVSRDPNPRHWSLYSQRYWLRTRCLHLQGRRYPLMTRRCTQGLWHLISMILSASCLITEQTDGSPCCLLRTRAAVTSSPGSRTCSSPAGILGTSLWSWLIRKSSTTA